MKKILVILAVLTTPALLFAQVSGGIKGGLNVSNQKWKVEVMGQSASQKYDGVNFHVGGYLNYALSEAMSLQPELLYNSLKFDIEGEDVTFNYISLPVFFGYGFEANKLILQAGPQIGVLVSTDPGEFKDDDFVKGIDFSFAMGAMVNLGKFNLSAHYALGISNIVDDTLNDALEDALGVPVGLSIKNNNFQISVGYRLFGE